MTSDAVSLISEFLDPFIGSQTAWLDGRAVWTTSHRLRYWSALLEAAIIIPAEFITDHASVPRLPLTWLIAGGRAIRSATLHDFIYQFGYVLLLDGSTRSLTRQEGDALFYESLRADPISGANRLIAWLMYRAVRLAGGFMWNARRARTATLNPEWTREWGVLEP